MNISTTDSRVILKAPKRGRLPITCDILVCSPQLPARSVRQTQCMPITAGSCPWVLRLFRSPHLPCCLLYLDSEVVGCLLLGWLKVETDLLAWDHPMKIRTGREPRDAPAQGSASLSYASGNKSHVPCAGERVKLTPFTRCSSVLWALRGLLLSNTYFKKVKLACSEWKVFVFFFFLNLLGELWGTCLHSRALACEGLLVVSDREGRRMWQATWYRF